MELQYIPDLACPICGNVVIIQETIESDGKALLKHSNGEQWEIRTFACGQALAYVPNFRRVERSD